MKYICVKKFRSINIGDLVDVKIGKQVYITRNNITHCTNEDMLNEYFKKEELK